MKAILVLDEMPIRCGDCILMHWNIEKAGCECYPMRKVIDPLSRDFDKYLAGEGHPDWCPLKEPIYYPDIERCEKDDYKGGWNDAMLQIGAISTEQAMPWMKED